MSDMPPPAAEVWVGGAVVRATFISALLAGPIATFLMMSEGIVEKMRATRTIIAALSIAMSGDTASIPAVSLMMLPVMAIPILFISFLPTLFVVGMLAAAIQIWPVLNRYAVWAVVGGGLGALLCPIVIAVTFYRPAHLDPSEQGMWCIIGAIDGALCLALACRIVRRAIARGVTRPADLSREAAP
jgi:hypothetical protein